MNPDVRPGFESQPHPLITVTGASHIRTVCTSVAEGSFEG